MADKKLSAKDRKARIKELQGLLADELEELGPEDDAPVKDKDVQVEEKGGETVIVLRGPAVNSVLAALGIEETDEEDDSEEETEEEDEEVDEDSTDDQEDAEDEELVEDETEETPPPPAKKKVAKKVAKKAAPIPDPKPPSTHRFFGPARRPK